MTVGSEQLSNSFFYVFRFNIQKEVSEIRFCVQGLNSLFIVLKAAES